MSLIDNVHEKVVAWYRQHGRNGERRIRRTRDGIEYVIGDWSWHRREGAPVEFIDALVEQLIEPEMAEARHEREERSRRKAVERESRLRKQLAGARP